MKISIRTVVLGAVLAVGAALPVAAQDVSFGYQFQRISCCGHSDNFPMGFNADASFPIGGGALSGMGQFDWSRTSDGGVTETIMGFGGGVRWSRLSNPKATPFVQIGVGAGRDSFEDVSETDLGVQVGGGVAVPINDTISAVGQADYRRVFKEDGGTNSIRFVGGIRITLKDR